MSYIKISFNFTLLHFSPGWATWYIFYTYAIYLPLKIKIEIILWSFNEFHHIPKCQMKMKNNTEMKHLRVTSHTDQKESVLNASFQKCDSLPDF